MKPFYHVHMPFPGIKHDSAESIFDWVKQNVKGQFMVLGGQQQHGIEVFDLNSWPKASRNIWCFESLDEALLFKLAWGGEIVE